MTQGRIGPHYHEPYKILRAERGTASALPGRAW